jgi:DNA ligase (NAD+)
MDDLATLAEILDRLAELGFEPVERIVLAREAAREGYDAFARRRPSLDYEIDGVVFKANLVAEQKRLGQTAHHPRHALAYKFQGESGATTLRSVEWSVARTGAITPVAIVDPVVLSGATVTRASLHHPGFVRKLELTLGAEVVLTGVAA